jgi:hypothetical protein
MMAFMYIMFVVIVNILGCADKVVNGINHALGMGATGLAMFFAGLLIALVADIIIN